METRDKQHMLKMKADENYRLVRVKEDLQKQLNADEEEFAARLGSEEFGRPVEGELGHTYYSKRQLQTDLDTTDLLNNERKLRKLYNIVHKQKIPVRSLSKMTQKRFKQLESAIVA